MTHLNAIRFGVDHITHVVYVRSKNMQDVVHTTRTALRSVRLAGPMQISILQTLDEDDVFHYRARMESLIVSIPNFLLFPYTPSVF
jgi:hypothetical protein